MNRSKNARINIGSYCDVFSADRHITSVNKIATSCSVCLILGGVLFFSPFPQDVRRTRSEIPVFREERARDWLQRCVALFCRERGLRYAQASVPVALTNTDVRARVSSGRCDRVRLSVLILVVSRRPSLLDLLTIPMCNP